MKKISLYFFTLFAVGSTITLAQTETAFPLMMLRRNPPDIGDHKMDDLAHPALEDQRFEAERNGIATETDAHQESTARNTATLASEQQSSTDTTKAENIEERFPCSKSEQIAFIAKRIDFLKNRYPKKIELLALLESYLRQYEQVLSSQTFDEWITDLIVDQQSVIALVTEFAEEDPSASCDVAIEKCTLDQLQSEYQLIEALLAPSPLLAKAQTFYKIRSAYLTEKEILKSGEKYLQKQNQCATAIDEYTAAEKEFFESKKAYDIFLKDPYEFNSRSAFEKKANLLYQKGIAKKRLFQKCKATFIASYGSLEEAQLLEKQHQEAYHAILNSSAYLHKKVGVLEAITKQLLGELATGCHHNLAAIFDLLAQEHFGLATAIEKNPLATDHFHATISVLKEVESAIQHQLTIFHSLPQVFDSEATEASQGHLQAIGQSSPNSAEGPELANATPSANHIKSFRLLQEAGHYFLLAYNGLKREPHSLAPQELCTQGRHFSNTAFVFQLPLHLDKNGVITFADSLAIKKAAQEHAERVIQEVNKEQRLYHVKIASFLHEELSMLNLYLQACELKQPVRTTSPSSLLLDQTASLFLKSRKYFQRLSELSLPQLNSKKIKLLIQVANKSKLDAKKSLSNITYLLTGQTAS